MKECYYQLLISLYSWLVFMFVFYYDPSFYCCITYSLQRITDVNTQQLQETKGAHQRHQQIGETKIY